MWFPYLPQSRATNKQGEPNSNTLRLCLPNMRGTSIRWLFTLISTIIIIKPYITRNGHYYDQQRKYPFHEPSAAQGQLDTRLSVTNKEHKVYLNVKTHKSWKIHMILTTWNNFWDAFKNVWWIYVPIHPTSRIKIEVVDEDISKEKHGRIISKPMTGC